MKARKKRVSPISEARRHAMAIYSKLRRAWLQEHSLCLPCKSRCDRKRNWTDDVHHVRGRAGTLLIDRRFWIPVCRSCHNWIGDNRAEARERGWLAQEGDWNSAPQDEVTATLRDRLAREAAQ